MSLDLQLALSGLGTAGAVALLALGLVVTFKGSGTLNFAHGAYATAAVYTYVGLAEPLGVAAAVVIGLAVPVAIAALVQVLVMQRLSEAPVLAKVVATLGVMLTIQAFISALTGGATPNPPRLLPAGPVTLGPGITIGADRLIILGIVVVLALGLAAAFARTRFGIVTRAGAQDEEAVVLTGTSVNRVALANGCIGAFLAGLAGILLAGFAPISPTFFTSVLITAIAAAMATGFRSVLGTVGVALLIGVAQAVIVRHSSSWNVFGLVGWAEALPVLVIMLVVLGRGRSIPVRGATARLGLPQVPVVRRPWAAALALLVVGGLLVWVLPVSLGDPLAMSMISFVICLSLVVLVGYAGQVSLGQMAFAGLAALVTARIASETGLGFPWAGIVGVVVAVVCGVVLALPALRVRGIELAVVTLGAALVLELMVFNSPLLNGTTSGSSVPPPELWGLDLDSITNPVGFGLLTVVVAALVLWAVASLRRSDLGRQMLSVRENEQGAAASGVSVTRVKLTAFVISSALAGVAGVLFVYRSGQVTYDSFLVLQSVFFVAIVYLGGIGSVGGALVVALFFAPGGIGSHLSAVIWHDGWMQVIAGLVLLQVVVSHPDGLAGVPRQLTTHRARRRNRTAATAPAPETPVPAGSSSRG
ncbi:ABC transporter permease [Pseudonocardia xishanensis]|uniref:Branched-chain amino acid transport system permease protein n=1 Tax=Pseudonocardia xishanensis TaxID=630995 RepID=A0ABP8RUR3_9PSEU